MLEQELKKLGLTEKEIKVYIAVLELGRASVQEISRKSGINRATTYIQLESLIKQGLVSSVDRDKKNIIIAERPQRILEILQSRKSNINQLEDNFLKLMPELDAIYNVKTDKPKVRFYQNREGIELIRKDYIVSKAKEICAFSPKLIDDYIPDINSFASKLDRLRMIFMNDKNVTIQKKMHRNLIIKYFQIDNFDIELTLYANKVLLIKPISEDNTMGVLIEDKFFHESFKAMFEFFWKMSQDIIYK